MNPAALVTGGAQRIGCAIALRLAQAGFAVAIQYRRSRAEADALASRITAAGGQACTVEADLADAGEVARLVDAAAAGIGPLTLLVNNASEFMPDEVGTLDRGRFEHQFAVNLTAPVFLAQDFVRQLPAEAEGSIVNIIDQRVWKPTPLFFSYALSKEALYAATRTMAQALAPRIRVNAVGPGPTLIGPRQRPEDFARQTEALPLRHGPGPDEIADAVLFLVRARSVTGQMIAVDGGQHLAWETPDVVGIPE